MTEELFYEMDTEANVFEVTSDGSRTQLQGADAELVRELLESLDADERAVRSRFGISKKAVLTWFLFKLSKKKPSVPAGQEPSPISEHWFWQHGDAGADVPRAGLPRRGWGSVPANVFVPYGIARRWVEEVVETAILPLEDVLRHGIPKAAYQEGFDGVVLGAIGALASLRSTRKDHLTPLPDGVDIDQPDLFDPAYGVNMQADERLGVWLPHRILNGMAPALLVKTADPTVFEARYSFADLQLHQETPYFTPDVAVQLRVVDDDTVEVQRISVAYRTPSGGFETPIHVDFDDATPRWRKLRAGRIAACALFLRGQLDQHVGRGHMVSEFLAVAVQRTLSKDHPLFCLLASRLEGVAAVNRAADCAIWGPNGLFTLGSQITHLGYAKALRERLAGLDWKRYRPMQHSIAEGFHYAPTMLAGSWKTVEAYVRDALTKGGSPSKTRWASAEDWRPKANPMLPWSSWSSPAKGDAAARFLREIDDLFDEIGSHALPFHAWESGFAGGDSGELLDSSELADGPTATGTAMSPLDPDDLFEDLVQFCTFAIFMATEAHSWANSRQKTDAGDPGWGAVSLRARLDEEPPPAADPSDTAWHARARPHPRDEIYQRGIGVILTDTRVDDIGMERDGISEVWDPRGTDGLGRRLVRYWEQRYADLPPTLPDPQFGQPASHLSRCDR